MTNIKHRDGVSGSIGYTFEKILSDNFPGLVNTNESSDFDREIVIPDFYVPEHNFWIEAKVGKVDMGTRIHKYQCDSFPQLEEPVIYALGYHDLEGLTKILRSRSPEVRRKYLDLHMKINQVYFVSSEIIGKLWEKDSLVSKSKEERYLTLKPSKIKHLIENKQGIVRKGKPRTPRLWYDYKVRDYDKSKLEDKGQDFPVGHFINKDQENVLNFLK